MPSLVLSAADVSKLLDANPEVKVELLKNATDQIAESLKRKISHGSLTLTEKLVKDITTDVSNRLRGVNSTFPLDVHKAIEARVQSYLERLTRKDIDAVVKKATDEALKRAEASMQAAAEAVIRKSFADMVDAASRLRR